MRRLYLRSPNHDRHQLGSIPYDLATDHRGDGAHYKLLWEVRRYSYGETPEPTKEKADPPMFLRMKDLRNGQ